MQVKFICYGFQAIRPRTLLILLTPQKGGIELRVSYIPLAFLTLKVYSFKIPGLFLFLIQCFIQ